MHFKNERCSGGKFSKVRLTGLAAARATGEKLPMFVIGKSAKPRCFKNVKNLPCRYCSQNMSWIDGILSQNGSGNSATDLLLKAERLHSSLITAPLTQELIICKQ